MKEKLKFIAQKFFGIEIKKINTSYIKGESLFEDLAILIKTENPLLVDVGSNYGQFIDLFLAKFQVYNIIGVEPDKLLYKELCEKYDEFSDIEFVNHGLGHYAETRIFNIYESRDLNSFLELNTHVEFKNIKKIEEQIVQIITLDSLVKQKGIKAIDLLKVDTQGFDYEVLKGTENAFAQRIVKNSVVELNFVNLYYSQNSPSEVISYLGKNGFKPVGIYDIFRDKNNEGISWCNMLFTLDR